MYGTKWLQQQRQAAAMRAHALIGDGDWVIWDSETTGLNHHSTRFVSIGVIDSSGNVLFDSLINPGIAIPPDATNVHGITDEMVADKPTFVDVYPALSEVLGGRRWVIYNAAFDSSILFNVCRKYQLRQILPAAQKLQVGSIDLIDCAMELYAAYHGDFNGYHESFTWQRLTAACQQLGIDNIDSPAHSAIGDCLRTLAVLRKMSETVR